MDEQELPVGFGFALAQNPAAMECFAMLSQEQRGEILRQVQGVSSKQEMQALADRLTELGKL